MQKQKKWQLFLILSVIVLTLHNILPTLFYYLKPLKNPINETQAEQIARSIQRRVDDLEQDSRDWLKSYCELISVKPNTIELRGLDWVLSFPKIEDASKFRQLASRAGSLIPFAPAQLRVLSQEEQSKEVFVQRRIPLALDQKYFSFAPKGSPLYKKLIIDRAAQIGYALAGPTESAFSLSALDETHLELLAFQINAIQALDNQTVATRCAGSFAQGPFTNRSLPIEALITAFEKKGEKFHSALQFLKTNKRLFIAGENPWTVQEIQSFLNQSDQLEIGNRNPFFSELKIDWANEQILLKLHPDVDPSQLKQHLMNEAAKISRLANEAVSFDKEGCQIALHSLSEASGFLALDLAAVGKIEAEAVLSLLKQQWKPHHPDLQSLQIVDALAFETLSPSEKALSLTVYPPGETNKTLLIIAKGLDHIQKNYQELPNSEQAQLFHADFRSLLSFLHQQGFQAHRGLNQELIFERPDTYFSLLAATREEFLLKGTQKYACLELSNLQERLLKENRIDTQIHEDLIKWKEEFNAAQVSIQERSKFDVPKPTKSVFLNNLLLSYKKMVRGDEEKVIRWGLDLSGGKTVQIELRDANRQLVKNEAEIKQGINELYNRVNKMGVSEVAIRQLGNQIVLDFPGRQSLSASELIKASSMYFHIVNEKFSSPASPFAPAAERFLQEVWNEALITNRKDSESIHSIAWKHLHGESPSEAARTLLENGLKLESPESQRASWELNDSVSKIAIFRSEKGARQNHPLLFVFRNYALEGSELSSVQSNYDPQKGNFLTFDVVSSAFHPSTGEKIYPRNNLQAWTSRFAKEKMAGTPLGNYSKGQGWRMAVILNDTVISAPTLEAVLRDSASISGHFSQREVHQLVQDLKAGSLSFTPHILSEKNVSPELGLKERNQGILATLVALFLVIGSMIVYYRFAGLIASIAVFFNLLILWATLQNIGATLSLAGIAGIILTVGMAVDANVLVFERIKEEFAFSKNISSAIGAGYKKAYSAIIDSNVTTIIAALILLNFDAGPIKGFAITLIIGIVSSMFTALFMTRFYFNSWIQNPKHTALKMANWVQAKSIDFLKRRNLAYTIASFIILIGGYLVYAQKATIFGMDFTGGYSLYLEIEPDGKKTYIPPVEKALVAAGASTRDFQIRELNPTHHLRLLFGTSMEEKGKPFYQLPLQTDHNTNARIDWVLNSLGAQGIKLTDNSLRQVESHWTAMSGQMSESMRNNALIGLSISFICIFIYIAFRFEYKFAAASILCLFHDVLITLGLMGILHLFKVPVQIDLNTVAAIMTIVGYSLNDTIIIFDRIREEIQFSRKKSLHSLVNQALNATLSRTAITSGTTLLVLLALVFMGGSSIFSFALVMTIGVFFGTLSSWYIACPLMLFFHEREEKLEASLK